MVIQQFATTFPTFPKRSYMAIREFPGGGLNEPCIDWSDNPATKNRGAGDWDAIYHQLISISCCD